MCGIAGAINYKNKVDVEALKDSLFHRGPNEQNILYMDNVVFVHTRLSILDIKGGIQPFSIGDYTIIFNGEIYNHKRLRQRCDHNFKTNSDTETLLALYIKYKEEMFEFLDGMFAFAIYDKSTNKMIFARDRAGKKPLYFYQKDDLFVFASELNAIKKATTQLSIDEDAIYAYLRCGFFPFDNTPYKNIKKANAGCYYKLDLGSLKLYENRYFDILQQYEKKKITDINEALNELEEALGKGVEDRLLSSDLEVGAFLSGGIDSSLVVAIASKYKQKLKTFTVKFDGAYDESHLAKLTAKMYDTDHYELSIKQDLPNDIEKILYNYGEPFMDSSAVPSYYVSQEAKKHVSVILNGDGADELFGGYRRYVPIANGWIKWAKMFSFLVYLIPKPNEKKSIYNYAYRLLSMSSKNGVDFYLSSTSDIFEDEYRFKPNTILQNLDEFIKKSPLEGLDRSLYFDFNLLLFSDLLVKMDIATMAHSLEGRSPFLSKYILELAPRLSGLLKVSGKDTKFILRELSKKYLPPKIIMQPKRGFEVPLKRWVQSDLKDQIFDSLSHESYSSNFIKKEFIQGVLDKSIKISDEKRAKMLWDMYCLEVWKKNQ